MAQAELLVQLDATTERLRREMRRGEQTVDRFSRRTDQNLRRIDRRFDQLARSVRRLAAPLAAAFSVRAVQDFATSTLQAADEIGKMSDQVRIGTDTLQEYRFAAEQSGVATSTLDSGLEALSRRVADARRGTGDLARVSSELGLDLSSTDAAFRDVADAVANATDEVEQAEIANAAFGRSGLELTRMLQEGRDALDRYGDELRGINGILDEDFIRRAERTNDMFNAFNITLRTSLQRGFLEQFSGDLDNLSDTMTDPDFQEGLERTGEAIGVLANLTFTAFTQFVNEVGRLHDFVTDPSFEAAGRVGLAGLIRDILEAGDIDTSGVDDLLRSIDEFLDVGERVRDVGRTPVGQIIREQTEDVTDAASAQTRRLRQLFAEREQLVAEAERIQNALARFMDPIPEDHPLRRRLRETELQIGLTDEEIARMRGMGAAAEAMAQGFLRARDAMDEAERSGAEMAARIQDLGERTAEFDRQAREAFDDTIEGLQRTVEEQRRLADAMAISQAAHDAVARRIEAENIVRESNIENTEENIRAVQRELDLRASQAQRLDAATAARERETQALNAASTAYDDFFIRQQRVAEQTERLRAAPPTPFAEDVQRDIDALIERTATPEERFVDEMRELDDLRRQVDNLNLSHEERARALRAISRRQAELRSELESTNGTAEMLDRAFDRLQNTFQSAFAEALAGGEDLRTVLARLVGDIQRLIIEMLVVQPLMEWLRDTIKDIATPDAGQQLQDFMRMTEQVAGPQNGSTTIDQAVAAGVSGGEFFGGSDRTAEEILDNASRVFFPPDDPANVQILDSAGQFFRGDAGSIVGTFAQAFFGGGPSGGGGGFGGMIGSVVGGLLPFQEGAAFQSGRTRPVPRGGGGGVNVVDRPTVFPMAGQRTGLMGEAGPEAIMPLERGADGRLGIRAFVGDAGREPAGGIRGAMANAPGPSDPATTGIRGFMAAIGALPTRIQGMERIANEGVEGARELADDITRRTIDNFIHAHLPETQRRNNRLIDLINAEALVDDGSLRFPIPQMQRGGVVTQRTLAEVGEVAPEAVLPLQRMMDGKLGVAANIGGGPSNATHVHNEVNIDARGADAEAVARIEAVIRQLDRNVERRAVRAVSGAQRRRV